MAGTQEIRVPDMGDFKDVVVIDVLVKPGDAVEVDSPLITLETDKATMDVPSTAAGVIEKVHIAKGGKISPGDLVATVRVSDGESKTDAPAEPAKADEAPAPSEADIATVEVRAQPAQGRPSPASEPGPSAPPKAVAPASPPVSIDVEVPDMGGFKDVAVIDVLVKAGDTVEIDSPLVTLETDKATMDIPSTAAGVVEKVHLAKGGKVSIGDRVVTLKSTGPAPASTAQKASATGPSAKDADESTPIVPASAPTPVQRVETHSDREAQGTRSAAISGARNDLPPIDEPGFSRAYAGPSVRKLAREMGVDLGQVTGRGVKGRITHDDVKAFVKGALTGPAGSPGRPGQGLPSVPAVDFAKFGPVETKPLTRIQKISGPRLLASWLNIPHVTQFDEADITGLEDARTQLKQKALQEGIKLTPLAFIMRACVRALQEFPQVNASLDAGGQNLILKKYFNIGFAADTPGGLVVPVLHNVDRCDVYEIARKLADLAEKARGGKLSPAEMQGGCFTISSLGGIGGTAFTPIINAPEVAILGISRSAMRPVFENGAFVPRLMLPLSFSYDHRVIDGATAARFTSFLATTLGDARLLTEAVP